MDHRRRFPSTVNNPLGNLCLLRAPNMIEMQASKYPRPKLSNWPPQSSHTVLIRNLQLLELDQLEDWPSITLRTLSPSSQNQRQRIKAVEWILFRLVALWDPETARDKLRPFFPPLEPLQSVNLRAALFRVLSDLKKNGDLGRETILRKSMLDDCKGEKFDELLAVFSTNVLRKKVQNHNPAIDLSLASGLTMQEYTLLLPLILAHRASMSTLGERRERIHNTHEKFSQLLDRKKDELDSRPASDTHVAQLRETDLEALARETRANWQGSAEWVDALLYGGLRSSRDAFLELPFDTAWSQAKASTVDDLRTTSTRPDLVLDLETRVLRQRARLQRWHQYSNSLKRSGTASPARPADTNMAPQLVFRDHQSLTVASISKAVRQPVNRRPPNAGDENILHSISEAMERINGSSRKRQSSPTPVPKLELEAKPKVSRPSPPIGRSKILEPPAESSTFDYTDEEPLKRRPRGIFTLTERTRKSISFFEGVPESPPQAEPTPIEDLPKSSLGIEEEPSESYTLFERTRKSMSLLPPPREPPRPPRRSRKSRVSFPVNQFETPPEPSSTTHDIPSRASTPRDELFEEQADYASVFKSRPRIALSPVASPAVHVSPIGDFDLSADGDLGEDHTGEDLDYVAVGSPLRSRGRW
ncbi:HAUS augmin-like complex subunit 6 N-terminus-domain-containing protein [Aspergillus recurvatus]